MNQPYQWLRQARRTDSGPAFIRRLRAARGAAAIGFASARRPARKPVAYSILFQ